MLTDRQRLGQSVWLDQVGRDMILNGSLVRHITDWSITGISLDPHTVCHTMSQGDVYDEAIAEKIREGKSGQALASELIFEDVRSAADLVRHAFDTSDGVDGWVSLAFSPLQVAEVDELKDSLTAIHSELGRPNILISIPGIPEYIRIIEELVFDGIPLNITFVCSQEQYLNAARAYITAVEKRIDQGLNRPVPVFYSIATAYLMRELAKEMGRERALELTVAISRRIYQSMRDMHSSRKWERAYKCGARILRLIWNNSLAEHHTPYDILLANRLIAPRTVTSMSESVMRECLKSSAHQPLMSKNNDDYDEVLSRCPLQRQNLEELAADSQRGLTDSLVKNWIMLFDMIAYKSVSIIQDKLISQGEER